MRDLHLHLRPVPLNCHTKHTVTICSDRTRAICSEFAANGSAKVLLQVTHAPPPGGENSKVCMSLNCPVVAQPVPLPGIQKHTKISAQHSRPGEERTPRLCPVWEQLGTNPDPSLLLSAGNPDKNDAMDLARP